MLSTPLRRSLAGLAVAAGLLPFLLALLACLPTFPVGDPETSRIDPGLTGVWIGQDGVLTGLLILRPYDARTWLGITLAVSAAAADAGQVPAPASAEQATSPDALLARMLDEQYAQDGYAIYKIWLTTFSGRRFLCWEPLSYLEEEFGLRPAFWGVTRVDTAQPDAMELRFPANQRPWSEVKSSAEAEKVLRDNADRDTFYDETLRYARVPPSAYAQVADVLKRFGLNQN